MSELSVLESTAISQAATDLKRLSAMFSGILKVGPVLDQIVSLQQAAEESEGRVAVARDQEAALKESIAGLDTQLAALNDRISSASARADNAEVEASGLVSDAAARMRDGARADAENATFIARQGASAMIAEAEIQCREMFARATADVDAKNAELAATTSAFEAAKAGLANATQAWEEFRAKVK